MKLLVILVLVCSLAASASPLVNNDAFIGRRLLNTSNATSAPTGTPTAAPSATTPATPASGSADTCSSCACAAASSSTTPTGNGATPTAAPTAAPTNSSTNSSNSSRRLLAFYGRRLLNASNTTSAPTGTPTAAPTGAPTSALSTCAGAANTQCCTTPTKITQVASVTHLANAAAYTGATKTLFERGYGSMIGICANTACSSYKTGGSVTSQASDTNSFRRGTVYVQFQATVAPADSAAARQAATAFTTTAGQTVFVNAMTAIKAADATTFGGVTVPTVAQVTGLAPTFTVVAAGSGNTTAGGGGGNPSASGAASESASWFLAVGLAVLALRQ